MEDQTDSTVKMTLMKKILFDQGRFIFSHLNPRFRGNASTKQSKKSKH